MVEHTAAPAALAQEVPVRHPLNPPLWCGPAPAPRRAPVALLLAGGKLVTAASAPSTSRRPSQASTSRPSRSNRGQFPRNSGRIHDHPATRCSPRPPRSPALVVAPPPHGLNAVGATWSRRISSTVYLVVPQRLVVQRAGSHSPGQRERLYQIFTDRFYNGDKSNDVETKWSITISEDYSRRVTNWDKYPANMECKGILRRGSAGESWISLIICRTWA